MNQKLLKDSGENFEYVRIIIKNRIELLKLKMIEDASSAVAFGVLFFSLFVVFFLFYVCLLVLLTIWIEGVIGSLVYAILITCGLVLLQGLILYVFRRPLIYKPVTNLCYSKIDLL